MPFDSAGHLGNEFGVAELPVLTLRADQLQVKVKERSTWQVGNHRVDNARIVGTSHLRSERRIFRPSTYEMTTRDSLVESIPSDRANEIWFSMREPYAIHARLGSYGFLARPWRSLDSFYWFRSIDIQGEHFLVKGQKPLPETNTCWWMLVDKENFTGEKIKPELLSLWDTSFVSCLIDMVKDRFKKTGC